jgi:hypothetical protein
MMPPHTDPPVATGTPARVHPIAWTILILPFGALSGFVGVVLGFLATRQGLTVTEGASLIAIGMLPHTWKFLWAPVADLSLSRRKWYLASAAVTSLGILAMSVIPLRPSTLHLMQGLVFVTNLASTTLGMAVEGLMTHHTPPEERGRAGGWFQAGNLGGGGVGGGLGLWMATNLPAPWMGGAILAVGLAACAGALALMADVDGDAGSGTAWEAVKGSVRDLKGLVTSRDGALAALICFLPIGTGAATGVMGQAAIAAKWGADESHVAQVNGVASGLVMAFGCLMGGELCRRFAPRSVYAAMGALMAGVALALSFAPLTPATFVAGGLAYALVTGFAYAAFTGLVLQVIEGGGAATKYNIFAALSNTPITYMGVLLAGIAEADGPVRMLQVEAGAGLVGIVVFYVVAGVVAGRAVRGVAR